MMAPGGRITAWLRATFSTGTLRFARNVSYLVGSDLLVSVVTFTVTATFIRRIGPEQFGIANLVNSVAQMALPALLVGLPTAATFHLARATDPRRVAGSALATVACLFAVVFPILWFVGPLLAPVAQVDAWVIRAGLVYAASYAVYFFGQGLLSGTARFASSARYNLASGLIFAALALAMVLRDFHVDATGFLAASGVRWLLYGTLAVWSVRALLGQPSAAIGTELVRYGSYYAFSSVVNFFVLGSIDALMLNAWHGAAVVGTYGAYYAAFNILVSRLLRQVSEVLMPTAAAHDDLSGLLARARRLVVRGAVPGVVGVAVLTAIVFRFYGQAYPFDWRLAVMMGGVVVMHTTAGLMSDLMAARGIAGLRANLAAAACTGVTNVTMNALLIPQFAIGGTMAASMIASVVAITYRWRALGRLAIPSSPAPGRHPPSSSPVP